MTHNEIDEFCEELASVLYRLNTPDFETFDDVVALKKLAMRLSIKCRETQERVTKKKMAEGMFDV